MRRSSSFASQLPGIVSFRSISISNPFHFSEMLQKGSEPGGNREAARSYCMNKDGSDVWYSNYMLCINRMDVLHVTGLLWDKHGIIRHRCVSRYAARQLGDVRPVYFNALHILKNNWWSEPPMLDSTCSLSVSQLSNIRKEQDLIYHLITPGLWKILPSTRS